MKINLIIILFTCLTFYFQDFKSIVILNNQKLRYNDTLEVINDEFIYDVLNEDVSYNFFKENFSQVSLMIHENQHYKDRFDSLVTFSNGIDSATYYIAAPNYILKELKIHSNKISIKNFQIGSSFDQVKSYFGLKSKVSELIIRDLEYGNSIRFIFEDNKIKEIIFKSTYID